MPTPFLTRRDGRFMLFGLGPGQASWRGVGWLALVFFGSLAVAAVLTPLLYWAAEAWHARAPSETTTWLLRKGIDNYFDRARLVVVLLGLPWLMTVCHLWSRAALGLGLDGAAARQFARGWVVGALLVFVLALAQWFFTPVTLKPLADINWPGLVAGAMAGGLFLGVVEETIFRGMILRMFYTAARRPWLAVVLMAAFFAYTHFKVPSSVWREVPPGVHWDTGWFIAYWYLFGITVDFAAGQFLALFLLGCTLGALTLRTGSLWPAIGLHAGMVAPMLALRQVFAYEPGPGRAFWGGGGLIDGWAAALTMASLFATVCLWSAKKPAAAAPR